MTKIVIKRKSADKEDSPKKGAVTAAKKHTSYNSRFPPIGEAWVPSPHKNSKRSPIPFVPSVVEAPPVEEASSVVRKEKVNEDGKVAGMTMSEISKAVNYAIGTERFIVAVEILKGGSQRHDVLRRIPTVLSDTSTTKLTPNRISAMMSSVVKHLQACGFEMDSHWTMRKR